MSETITINNKVYKTSDLSEKAKGLVNDIALIQNGIKDKNTEVAIYTIASDTLMNELVKETADLKEVEQTTDSEE